MRSLVVNVLLIAFGILHSLQSAIIIADFTVDEPTPRAAAYDPDGLVNLSAGWGPATSSPFLFQFDLSSFNFAPATQLLIEVRLRNS